jgi:hypothetical protein
MAYKFKSTTGSDILHSQSGIIILSSSYVTCSSQDVAKMFDQELVNLLTTGQVVFNDGSSDYSAASALTRIDWNGNNFSYKYTGTTETLAIPPNQQHLCYEEYVCEGELVVEGDMVILD